MRSLVVSFFQNAEINQLPLLEIIVLGSLQSFYTQSRNSQAIVGINILGQAIKYLILDSQSITTIIFIQPLLIGRLITKLIKISFYLQSGIGSSFRSLLYILYKALAYQQVWQLEIYFRVILYIFEELKLKFIVVRYNQAVSIV